MIRPLLLSLLLVLAGSPWLTGQTYAPDLDSIFRAAVHDYAFEGVVLIADQGKTVFHRSAGYRDAGKTRPVDNDTRFGIASITKMITAVVVLQLYEEGKLELTDDLAQLLPDLDIPNAGDITIHHLLLHISGLPNEDDRTFLKPVSPQEFVRETIGDGKRIDSPGSFNYANVDYVLLGLVIEAVEKKTWQQSVQERFIDRLQLDNTGFLARDRLPENYAGSFSFNTQGERVPDPAFYIENYYAAGCMYSDAADLLKIDQALYDAAFLKEETRKRMFRSYPEYNYTGYSVWTYNYPFLDSQPRLMERRGGILGNNCVLVRFLDSNKTLIILSNNNRFNPDTFGQTQALKEALIMAMAQGGR